MNLFQVFSGKHERLGINHTDEGEENDDGRALEAFEN